MAQCQRHGVRRVVGSGHRRKIAYAANHVHDLLFFGPAVAHHGLFDLQGRIFVHRHILPVCGKQDNSPAVSHGNTGGDIGVEKSSSTERQSGLKLSISSSMSSNIWFRRLERLVWAGVVITPHLISLWLTLSESTTPKPTVAIPGSMPRIRIYITSY